MNDLVEISKDKFDVILDIRYATKNNVCGVELYKDDKCYLHKDVVKPFQRAIDVASKFGLKFKIFDGFRPISVQKFMFDKFASDPSKDGFVSNPVDGSIPHCRGVAIDLTLVDENNKEIDMGTGFDDFSDLSCHNCFDVSNQAQKNRIILLGIMTSCGFDFYQKEWWHYQLFNPRNYPIIENEKKL